MVSWRQLTNQFSWFVCSLVYKVLERFLQAVAKLLVFLEANTDDVVHLVLEVQQLLNHRLVLFRIDHNFTSFLL